MPRAHYRLDGRSELPLRRSTDSPRCLGGTNMRTPRLDFPMPDMRRRAIATSRDLPHRAQRRLGRALTRRHTHPAPIQSSPDVHSPSHFPNPTRALDEMLLVYRSNPHRVEYIPPARLEIDTAPIRRASASHSPHSRTNASALLVQNQQSQSIPPRQSLRRFSNPASMNRTHKLP